MASIRVRRHILRWGNSYGIRLTRDEVERLHAADKTPVQVDVSTEELRVDHSQLPKFRLGPDASRDHTRLAEEGADAGY